MARSILASIIPLGLIAVFIIATATYTVPESNLEVSRKHPRQSHRRLAQSAASPSGVPLDARPVPSQSQLASFKKCLDDYSRGSSSSSTISEAGRNLRVTLQQDSQYGFMKDLNAQTRGAKLQPVAFAEPGSTEDVAAAVKCSVSAGLKFAARNGGHQYEANSLLDGGVVIDLRALRDVQINTQDNTVRLGAGQKLGGMYAALSRAGYTLPGGTCVGVGISGLTLGGGLGHASRNLGLMADSVVSATVVLADGTIVQANANNHPDLFWAIRGGGPLYGIVTSWIFKLHKAPAKASIVKYKFRQNCTESKWAEVLTAWNAWKPWQLSQDHALADIECGYDHLWVQIWVWGPLDQAMKTVASSPVFQLEGAYPFTKKEFDWPDFVVRILTNLHDTDKWTWANLALSNVGQDQGSFVAGSLLPTSPLSKEAINTLAKYTAEVQQHAFVQARAWGGAMQAVGEDFDAFPWRARPMEMQVYSSSGTAKDRDWIDRLLSAMQPLIGTDSQLYGYFHCVKDPWKVYFGQHADRLQQIKKVYDPQNRLGGLNCQQGVLYA